MQNYAETADNADALKLAEDQTLWVPDTFFHNEQEAHGHDIDRPNRNIEVSFNPFVVTPIGCASGDSERDCEVLEATDYGLLVSNEAVHVPARSTSVQCHLWQL